MMGFKTAKATKFLPISKENRQRFCNLVDAGNINDCWIWIGALGITGHGRFKYEKAVYAHRFALVAATGKEIPAGIIVRHLCDTRACVNPRHLKKGTQSENVQDAIKSGTHIRNRNELGQFA